MRLRILGMNGPFPEAGGACSGYYLSVSGKRLLLDCGAGVFSRLISFCDPLALDCLLISHFHHDHASDLGVLGYYLAARGGEKPLTVMAPERSLLIENPAFHYHESATLQLGGVLIETMPVRHPISTFAYRVTSENITFVYSGDTNTTSGLVDFCRGADLLLLDACLPQDAWTEQAFHLSARHAAQIAKDAGAKRLVLTHLNPSYAKELLLKEARAVFSASHLAASGDLYEI